MKRGMILGSDLTSIPRIVRRYRFDIVHTKYSTLADLHLHLHLHMIRITPLCLGDHVLLVLEVTVNGYP